MLAPLPLLSLAMTALAAPPMTDFGSDSGSDMPMTEDGSDYGSDMGMDDDGSNYGSEAEDFFNLTMSRAIEERAINTCNCAPVSSSDRIVVGRK